MAAPRIEKAPSSWKTSLFVDDVLHAANGVTCEPLVLAFAPKDFEEPGKLHIKLVDGIPDETEPQRTEMDEVVHGCQVTLLAQSAH